MAPAFRHLSETKQTRAWFEGNRTILQGLLSPRPLHAPDEKNTKAHMGECKLQEAICDFHKTGEGCKAKVIASSMPKHKQKAIGKHVDLLNDETKALREAHVILQKSVSELKEDDLQTLRKDFTVLQETVDEKMKKMREEIDGLSRAFQDLSAKQKETEEKSMDVSKLIGHDGGPPPVYNSEFRWTNWNKETHDVTLSFIPVFCLPSVRV